MESSNTLSPYEYDEVNEKVSLQQEKLKVLINDDSAVDYRQWSKSWPQVDEMTKEVKMYENKITAALKQNKQNKPVTKSFMILQVRFLSLNNITIFIF